MFLGWHALLRYDKFLQENQINKEEIRFILKTLNATGQVEDTFIPITNPEDLWTNAKYKQNKPLVFYISGYATNLDTRRSISHDSFANAYVKYRPEVNFVVRFVFQIDQHKRYEHTFKTRYFLFSRPLIQVIYILCYWINLNSR